MYSVPVQCSLLPSRGTPYHIPSLELYKPVLIDSYYGQTESFFRLVDGLVSGASDNIFSTATAKKGLCRAIATLLQTSMHINGGVTGRILQVLDASFKGSGYNLNFSQYHWLTREARILREYKSSGMTYEELVRMVLTRRHSIETAPLDLRAGGVRQEPEEKAVYKKCLAASKSAVLFVLLAVEIPELNACLADCIAADLAWSAANRKKKPQPQQE